MAYVEEAKKETLRLEDIRVVYEFPDVFPEELPDLPPEKELEFTIDLILGTRLISIPPYRIALIELKELNEQF